MHAAGIARGSLALAVVLAAVAAASGAAAAGTAAPAISRAAFEPAAVVPTGKRLDELVRRAPFLVVGARNEPRAARLLQAAGGRPLLTRVSIWLVPAGRVKELLARANTPRRKLVRFVEAPADRTDVVEPLPPAVPYVFSDPLAGPAYAWHLYAIGADQVQATGPGFPVTVFDSGLDTTHPDFAGRPNTLLLNAQSTALDDQDYHGTMVASTAAAALNGIGAEGVYPAAALRSYDFDYSTAESYFGGFAAAQQAGPSVVNMSFGGTDASRADYEAALSTFAGGSLLVAAAGNEYEQGNPTSYPGAYPHVLTVAATDQTGAPAAFSSAGQQVDLAAPGVAIPVQAPSDPRAYFAVDGTSFAAPIVSAAAAWVTTARPMEKTQLFELLRRSARDAGPAGWDERTGFGILDVPALFATPLPAVDPLEPNDDVDQVTAGALFASAKPTIDGRGVSSTVAARVDAAEDPRDVYRVAVPAGARVTLTLGSGSALALSLWGGDAESVIGGVRARLGSSSGRAATISWTNGTGGARVVYACVSTPAAGTHLTATYGLQVRVARPS